MCWGRSAHPAPLSPEVTGPGLGRGARATGSPRGQGPLQLGSRFQEQESRTSGPTSCPGTAAPTTPACRAKRKQGRGGGGPSQLCPGDSALTRGPGQTEARATGSGGRAMSIQAPMRVHPSPAQHSTERRGQLSRTRSSGLTAPPGLPPVPRPLLPGRLPACVRPSIRPGTPKLTGSLLARPGPGPLPGPQPAGITLRAP